MIKPLTPDEAVRLEYGDHIHDEHHNRWKINGRPKIWATGRFQVPIKYGLYGFSYITDHNADEFHTISECGDLMPYAEEKAAAIANIASEKLRKQAESRTRRRLVER